MRKLFCSIMIGLLAGVIANAVPVAKQPALVGDLISQVRQYAEIKTIHFQAVGHCKIRFKSGKIAVFKNTYSYWGDGSEFRIDFQQFTPGGEFDVLITDNGKHYRRFDRIADQLVVLPAHPSHGEGPYIRCPILEPLAFLAPPKARWHWLNLSRIASDAGSVIDRCRKARRYRGRNVASGLVGRLTSSLYGRPVVVRFTVGGGAERLPLVTGWVATRNGRGGKRLRVRLGDVRYRAFTLKSGATIHLPVAFVERSRQNPSAGVFRVMIHHISIDQPISPEKFTIDYKLARVVVDETGRGKPKYITVQPTHAAPGGTRNLK